MNIGFIGLGTMGKPMAQNLLKAGYSLIVYNRSEERTQAFQGQDKVRIAGSPAEAAANSDIIFTMLSNDAAVEEVYFGDKGVLVGCEGKSGSGSPIVIDCSTISPEMTKKTAEALDKAGIDKLEAPVTGSEPQAIDGVLTFIVGGKREIFEKVEELLLTMGKKAVFMGGPGSGAVAKLANNMMVATHLAALSESLSMIMKSGGDPSLFLEVVAGGGARSGMAEMKGPKILEEDYSPQFMVALMSKDLGLAAGLAEGLKTPLPVGASVRQIFQTACNNGLGDQDMSGIFRLYEQWAELKRS